MTKYIGFLLIVVISFGCKKKDEIDLNTLFTTSCEGCHSFRVFKYNTKKSVGISVSGNPNTLGLSSTNNVVVDIDTVSKNDLWAIIREYKSTPGVFQCINTIDFDPNTAILWEATEGIATLSIGNANLPNNTYELTVKLENVVFTVQGGGETLELDELEFSNVVVGD